MAENTTNKFVFFGTPLYSIYTLEALLEKGYMPSLIVTAPDQPVGRHFTLTPSEVKVWAQEHNIPTLEPKKITEEVIEEIRSYNATYFVVAAYGKILPKKLLDIPLYGTLNVHPSLLPLYRGPAPEKGPILSGDTETGVTIILLDELVDHGPILAQETVSIGENETTPQLAERLFTNGGHILADLIPKVISKKIIPQEQDHSKATFTKKVKKEDGFIDLAHDHAQNYNKYRAYKGWPGVYFFTDLHGKKVRVKITEASYEDGAFTIKKIIPEGKKEMLYSDFARNL